MIQDLHRIIQLIENNWRGVRVLVIGDLMLDRYIWGDVERISPEAPVPVVRVAHQNEQPGGAGNVAMNVKALGAQATLLGCRGDDPDGRSLEEALVKAGITSDILQVATHPTTVKLRVVAGKQQLLRLDTEKSGDYPTEVCIALLAKIKLAIANTDAVVLSDYAKGTLTEEVCQQTIGMARHAKVPVLVDPKRRSFARYRGATTICPNLTELSAATGISHSHLDEVLDAGQTMVKELNLDCMTATMSEKGIALLRAETRIIAPAQAREVFDVSGAGDTVIATLALALAGGLEMEVAVQLANLAAGISVSKLGTAPVYRNELLDSLMREIGLHTEEKVLSLDELLGRVAAWRMGSDRIVFTNGCFDLLHIGHITLLEEARRSGDKLVVAINSDASVSKLKGPTRPIVGERERSRILAALSVVDAIVIFDEPTPLHVIELLRPNVIVKGGDYAEDSVVGAKEVRSWGGRVKIIPTVDGFSTTKLITKATTP